MENKIDKIASKYLGQKVDGSSFYDPSLLVAIPRFLNREQYDISSDNLPFDGFDVWHAYEFSCLTQNGLPITKVLKIKYPCDSKFIIESKSLKLYLNSFNMSKFGKNIKECLDICKGLIEKDLSRTLEKDVEINFVDECSKTTKLFDDYEEIVSLVCEENIIVENFKEAPELLDVVNTDTKNVYKLKFSSLRSNCRVTHQPDFGDVFIYYNSFKHIKEDSLIKYLCSFRSEYHFHEECCEMIFKRLFDILNPNDELMVVALYTRRGGIDICPVRWTENISHNDFAELININKFARNGIKQ